MGPTLKNLNNLLNLPFGCGEQNMANFAPNVYVLKYLSGTDQLTDEVKSQAMYYLQTGECIIAWIPLSCTIGNVRTYQLKIQLKELETIHKQPFLF